jgi:hypothetical protein
MSKSPFKSSFILFATFLLLLCVVYFFTSDGAREGARKSSLERPYLSSSVLDKAGKIIITKSTGESTELIVDENGWMLNGRAIDENLQEEFEEKILKLPKGRSVSKNAENWSEYGLGDENASIQIVMDENVLAVLRFGKQSSGPGGVFMRRDDDDTVYKVATSLQQYQYYDDDQWMSKALIKGEIADLTSFTARVLDEKWTFVSESDQWKMSVDGVKSEIEDQAIITNYLETLFALKATGFEHDVDLFGEAEQAISLQFGDGSEYIVSVDVLEENKVYARVTDGYDLFTLSTDLESHLRPSFLAVEESPESEAVTE